MKIFFCYKKITALCLLLAILCTNSIFAQVNIVKAEYFIDTDPGFGLATNIPVAEATNISNQAVAVDLSAVSAGFHTVNFRSQDANGKWSITNPVSFYKLGLTSLPNIVKAEYFIDTDPGFGLATNIPVAEATNISNQAVAVDLSAVSAGFHTVNFRSKDANGKWSITNPVSFYKIGLTSIPNIVKAEYFIDTDPGFGLATNIPVTAATNISNQAVAVDLSAVSAGFHTVNFRSKDANGKWSVTNPVSFYKLGLTSLPNIVKAEYFIDTDPGFGLATNIPVAAATNISNQAVAVDLSAVSAGFHTVNFRSQDANGKWSVTNPVSFYKIGLTSIPNIVKAEYFIDTDPGFGLGKNIPVSASINIADQNVSVNIGTLQIGLHRLYIRSKDANGKWSITNVDTFRTTTPPIANMEVGVVPTSLCAGANVNIPFTSTITYNSGNIFTAQLSSANGAFGIPTNIGTLTATSAGTIAATIPANTPAGSNYRVRVIASNPLDTSIVNDEDIIINRVPEQTFTITGDATTCTETKTYNISVPQSGVTYTWALSGGGTLSSTTGTNVQVSWVTAGTHTLSVTPSNGCGNGATVNLTVTVNTPTGDTAIFGNNQWNVYAYNGNDILLGAGNVFRGNYTINSLNLNSTNEWNPNTSPSAYSGYTGCPVNTDNFTWVYKRKGFPSGNYVLNNLGTDDEAHVYKNGVLLFNNLGSATTNNLTLGSLGVTDSIEIRVKENTGPAYTNLSFTIANLNAGVIAANQTGCGGFTPLPFTSISSAYGGSSLNISYQWQQSDDNIIFTDIATANGLTYTAPPSAVDMYYRRKAFNANGEVAYSDTLLLDITPMLTPSIVLEANHTAICNGASVTFTASAINPGLAPVYKFKVNGVLKQSGALTTYTTNTLLNGDVVSVELTANNICQTTAVVQSNTITITVNEIPNANAGLDVTITRGSSTTLTATSSSSGTLNYLWNNGSTNSSITVSPLSTTKYWVKVTNAATGCISVADTVYVNVTFSDITILPNSYNFSNVVVDSNKTYAFTLKNTGTNTETINSASVNAPFTVINFLPQALLPNATMQIFVKFSPTATLQYISSLQIGTSNGNFTAVVNGVGVLPQKNWSVSPLVIQNGLVNVGTTKQTNIDLVNTGNVFFSILNATSNNPKFTIQSFPTVLPIGTAPQKVLINYLPTAVNNDSAIITIIPNEPGHSPVLVKVYGTGFVNGPKPTIEYTFAKPVTNEPVGVNPHVGLPGMFTYEILYKSTVGFAPMAGYPKVGIDINGDGDFTDASEGVFVMTKVGVGTNWVAGEKFRYQTNLPIGLHYGYQYFALDVNGNEATSVDVNYQAGPLVSTNEFDLSTFSNDITASISSPIPGDTVLFTTKVYNTSIQDAYNVPVSVYIDSIKFQTDTIPFIAAASNESITLSAIVQNAGMVNVKIWVDSSGTLGETNLLNNYASSLLFVGQYAELIYQPDVDTVYGVSLCNSKYNMWLGGRVMLSVINTGQVTPIANAQLHIQFENGDTLNVFTDVNGRCKFNDDNGGLGYPFGTHAYSVTISAGVYENLYNLNHSYTTGIPDISYYEYPPVYGAYCSSTPDPIRSVHYSLIVNKNTTLTNNRLQVYIDGFLIKETVAASLSQCDYMSLDTSKQLNVGLHTYYVKHSYIDANGVSQQYVVQGQFEVDTIKKDLMFTIAQRGSGNDIVTELYSNRCNENLYNFDLIVLDSLFGSGQYVRIDSIRIPSLIARYQTIPGSNPPEQVFVGYYFNHTFANLPFAYGMHKIKIIADPHHVINDVDTTNNIAILDNYLVGPDLEIKSFTSSTQNYQIGQQINFATNVKNLGLPSGNYKLAFVVNGDTLGSKILMPNLNYNDSITVLSNNYLVTSNCPLIVKVIADCDSVLTEANELNNSSQFLLGQDLKISAITERRIDQGKILNEVLTVTNSSSKDVIGNIRILAKINSTGVVVKDTTIINLAHGQSKNINISFLVSLPLGVDYIVYKVDVDSIHCETIENNNSGSIKLIVLPPKPDWVIIPTYISPSNVNPEPGEQITIVTTIKNIGTIVAPAGTIKFLINNIVHGDVVAINSLQPNADTTVACTLPYSSSQLGPHNITAIVDEGNLVLEESESNNVATRQIRIGSYPDFTFLDSLYIVQPSIRKGDIVQITDTVKNIGAITCNAKVKFTFIKPNGVTSLINIVPVQLESQEKIAVTTNWTVADTAGKIIATIINANPEESNIMNNADTLIFNAGQLLKAPRPKDTVICTGNSYSVTLTPQSEGQPFEVKWYVNNQLTSQTGLTYAISNATVADSGWYKAILIDAYDTVRVDSFLIKVVPVSNVYRLEKNIIINDNFNLATPHVFFPCWLGGKLELNDFNLTINGNITGYDATHFVATNGTGKLIINNTNIENLFPVSVHIDSASNFINIKNEGQNDEFRVNVKPYVLQNGESGSAITENFVNRTWFITEEIPGGSNVTLKPYWNITNEMSTFDRTKSTVAHYITGNWSIGNAVAATLEPNGQYTTIKGGITSFSPFSVAEGAGALPLNLLSFTGLIKNNKDAYLTWYTTNETNFSHFEIERSTNGITFNKIAITTANNTAGNNAYQYIDANLQSNVYFYRLKMVDIDGKFKYSSIIKLAITSNPSSIQVFPNPTTDRITISGLKGSNTIKLTSVDGRLLLQQKSTNQSVTLPLNQFAAGTYIVEIDDGVINTVQKVVKQ
ncbi:MAG: T9SS type A sorting domain-containing protein [Ferruginibacter sp.]|nr:T9SS type A sorting domain-containing protein [Ferruginibacter sp.]